MKIKTKPQRRSTRQQRAAINSCPSTFYDFLLQQAGRPYISILEAQRSAAKFAAYQRKLAADFIKV